MTETNDQNQPATPVPPTDPDRTPWTTPELQKLPASSTSNPGPTGNPDGSFSS
jgi:hypothetical protein